MKFGQLIAMENHWNYCHQMSRFRAKMNQIRFLASVRLSLCPFVCWFISFFDWVWHLPVTWHRPRLPSISSFCNFVPRSHPVLSYPSPNNGVCRLTYFNIWRGGPPGRRTNRPTSQAPATAYSVKLHKSFRFAHLIWITCVLSYTIINL